VEQDTLTLLSEDAGTEKLWFEGLALLNLGILHRRTGRTAKAKELFARASERYAAYRISPEQPIEWQLVSDFFTEVAYLTAFGETDKLKQLAEKMGSLRTSGKEYALNMEHLDLAIRLYQHHAQGANVRTRTNSCRPKRCKQSIFSTYPVTGRGAMNAKIIGSVPHVE